MRHSCESNMQTQAEARPSFLGWRKLCVPFCCLCDEPCLRSAPSSVSRSQTAAWARCRPHSTGSDQLCLITANYAFHCPDTKDDRMCGLNMFHIVSASFCIKDYLNPLNIMHSVEVAQLSRPKAWPCLYGLHVLTTVGGRTKMQIVQNHDEKRLQTWYFDFCYL